MPEFLTHEIENLKNSSTTLSNREDYDLFSFVCLKHFYKNGVFENSDIRNHHTDGSNDGGIDLIFSDIDNEELIFIQDKYISSLSNAQDVINMLTEMHQTIERLKNNDTANLNSKLLRVYGERKSDHDQGDYASSLAVFIGCKVSENIEKKIRDEIATNDNFSDYKNINVFFKNHIEDEIQRSLDPPRYVEEGKVFFDKEAGCIDYSHNGVDGMIVNISAKSVKDLYNTYKDDGLFEKNFRYYIQNKKIDDQIKLSLRNNTIDNFWFLNNGMIIGCDEAYRDGDNIKLHKFSIINGCQTATLIGQFFQGSEDFHFQCKIIQSRDEKFIADVAQASNSQKPINDRDLKSNSGEMRSLQKNLKVEDPKIFMKIKRGENFTDISGNELSRGVISGLEDYQKIDNPYYGKVVLSGFLQKPGTARNSPAKIFGNEEIYAKVFKRTFDKESTVDMLKLYKLYSKFKNGVEIREGVEYQLSGRIRKDDQRYLNTINAANNGEFLVPAALILMIKIEKNLVDIDSIGTEQGEMQIISDSLSGKIFKDELPSDFEVQIFDLFYEIISNVVDVYIANENTFKNLTNFLKSDIYYYEYIVPRLKGSIFQLSARRELLKTQFDSLFRI
jgi:hypothetical protein